LEDNPTDTTIKLSHKAFRI